MTSSRSLSLRSAYTHAAIPHAVEAMWVVPRLAQRPSPTNTLPMHACMVAGGHVGSAEAGAASPAPPTLCPCTYGGGRPCGSAKADTAWQCQTRHHFASGAPLG